RLPRSSGECARSSLKPRVLDVPKKGVADFLQEVTSRKDQDQDLGPIKDLTLFLCFCARIRRCIPVVPCWPQARARTSKTLLTRERATPRPITSESMVSTKRAFEGLLFKEWLLMKRNSSVYIFKMMQVFTYERKNPAVQEKFSLGRKAMEMVFVIVLLGLLSVGRVECRATININSGAHARQELEQFWIAVNASPFGKTQRAANLQFPSDHISASAKDLITGMLCTDPTQRLTASKVLEN
ncbi:hypothetical protein IFM89_020763, partial [Coptis chinensis]